MNRIKIAIAGASGRMGRHLVKVVYHNKAMLLKVALTRKNSSLLGIDAGELAGIGKVGVLITDNLLKNINDFDMLIDFTCPKSTLVHLNICRYHKKAMIIGTTGFDNIGKKEILAASKDIGIVFTPNFSIGINLMLNLLRQMSKVMGDYADIEILEAHHRYKVDAPSGTALEIGETIANTMDWKLDEHAVYLRKGNNGSQRKPHSIGFSTVRAGDIIGEHSVMFADIGERLEITHKASSRVAFANGAIKAANWLQNKKAGLYDMNQVLNLFNQ
ncbi:4-hydroxy-tetrahydrodipicolinate reductase [Pantoea sp. Aalb]|uniref:4-hydroxy-tetrahydrodipicolinate reductase n=1 Tax=Pantoea sp. Aalb TaxID=2576762 RepID=UPI00132C3A42|nr:4-hydroxy-tetrahydrodipicolinate reductase [Pantoea sp. Aalb]MXP67163.1 4-hydroxy-tetrahydrodipicolinate reductase [Pantoea sp. Aalb]